MAKELKLTQNLTGWFDVRVYKERIAKENRKIKGEEENIAFTVTFAATDPQAPLFVSHGKPYADSNGNNRLRVTFKIRPNGCRWFDENAQPVGKPANAELDGKPFECVIQYSELAGDPANDKAPRGYWVNAIQFREVVTNPFAAMPGATPMPPRPVQQPQETTERTMSQQPQRPTGNIGFPPPPPEDLFAPQPGNVGAPMPPMYNDNLPY